MLLTSHLCLDMTLFSLFHLILKSLQNSNQSVKTWAGKISGSPECGFSPKYSTRSEKLRKESHETKLEIMPKVFTKFAFFVIFWTRVMCYLLRADITWCSTVISSFCAVKWKKLISTISQLGHLHFDYIIISTTVNIKRHYLFYYFRIFICPL